MKRDFQLIRKLLLEIEDRSNGIDIVTPIEIKNYTQEQIQYHLALLNEAGLILAHDASAGDRLKYIPIRLSWDGHEFIDNARNDTVWNKTLKDIGEFAGSVALPILRELLTAAIRAQLMPH